MPNRGTYKTSRRDATNTKRPVVVTWCCAIKHRKASIDGSMLPRATQAEVAAAWLDALAHAEPMARADELYGGRSFALAKATSQQIDADLAILSAGLGYVLGDTRVPSYDLTLVRGGLGSHIVGELNSRLWWDSILRGPFSSSPSDDLSSRPYVLACLSHAYAPLIVPNLVQLPKERIRIFGALGTALPADLAPCALPYDDRLASLGFTGTRSDFAQRALTHYATHIYSGRSLAHDRAAVLAALEHGHYPETPPARPSLGDSAIRKLIIKLLPTLGARRTPMLQHLRHVEGVACEQARFARLFGETIADRK